MLHPRFLAALVLPLISIAPVSAQSVLSARSGVLNLVEGSVQLDGMQVQQKFGAFPGIPEGSELRTQNGHAEVLLTPGAFLRVGENSAIRMISTSLVDTRVEFLSGSMMLEMTEPAGDTQVTIIANERKVHFPKEGLYRFDSDPLQVMVYRGEADIRLHEKSLVVNEDRVARLDQTLGAQQFSSRVGDDLETWSRDRNDSLTADNFSEANDPKPLDFSGVGQTSPGDPASTYGYGTSGGYSTGSYPLSSNSYPYSVPGPVYLGSGLGYPLGLTVFGGSPYAYGYGPGAFYPGSYLVPTYGTSPGSGGGYYRYRPGTIIGGGAIRRPLPTYRLPGAGGSPARVTIAPAPRIGAGAIHVGGHK